MSYVQVLAPSPDMVVGVEWDTSSSSPALKQINAFGEQITKKSTTFFDGHPIWGGMKRCTVIADGTPTFGSNARGDGLTLNGTTGQVMVRIPKFYIKATKVGTVIRWWISPFALDGFDLHPAFKQRGGTERAQLYVGAYTGSLAVNQSTGALYMLSATGKQPWTGTCMGKIPFGSGVTEIVAGNVVTGASSGKTGTVVAVYKASGTWGSDAAGFIYVKYPGADWANWTNPENIQVGGATVAATTGTGEALGLTIANSETYCNNIGSSRWGCENIWTLDAISMLYVVEYANWNSQSTSVGIGRGIVDKASGTGFAGENNGSFSSDTNIATNGTGTGTGSTDGKVPIVYRGIENLWGNVYQFIIGIDVLDAAYRVLKRDGTGAVACPLASGQYESSVAAPVQYADPGNLDSYAKDILYEDLSKYLILPNLGGGSDSTYLCDRTYWHRAGQTNIFLVGGSWTYGAYCGVGCRLAHYGASSSARYCGCRLEFC